MSLNDNDDDEVGTPSIYIDDNTDQDLQEQFEDDTYKTTDFFHEIII